MEHHPAVPTASAGEQALQEEYGTRERARRFYDEQVLDHLNDEMRAFVARQELLFLSTADARGACDSSLRAGPPGFVQVLDDRTLACPEYRGNGVHASLGNISENPQVGMLFVDFAHDVIGLHVNGRAGIVDDALMRRSVPDLPEEPVPGRRPARWVLVEVEEAYVHCSKHIPRMIPMSRTRDWGTDSPRRKGGDFFGARDTPRYDRAAAVPGGGRSDDR